MIEFYAYSTSVSSAGILQSCACAVDKKQSFVEDQNLARFIAHNIIGRHLAILLPRLREWNYLQTETA